MSQSYCIGNGQMHQIQLQDQVGTLNCMHDQQMILERGDEMKDVRTVVRRLTPL